MARSEITELQSVLPVQFNTWCDFWDIVKEFDTDYITINLCYIEDDFLFGTEEPLDYKREYIRERAIAEAVENEDYERAETIKRDG